MTTQENNLESELCERLGAQGWLYSEGDAAARYDRARALYPDDLVGWVQQRSRRRETG